MALLHIITSIVLALLSWSLITLSQNYLRVCKIGLPVLFSPFGRLNPIWILTEPYFAPILRYLSTRGFPIFNFIHYSTTSWFFYSRHTLHLRYGPAFFIVSPGAIQLIIADSAAAEEIQLRRKDFVKSEQMYKPLEIFGPNVDTLNGDSWARHRRITTPPFNERNSSLVWKESLLQANGMLRSWMGKASQGGVANTPTDTMTLALHVLTAAGFGKNYDFEGGVQGVGAGHTMSYRDALKTLLGDLFRAMITSSLLMSLPSWAMPKKLEEMKSALREFRAYMVEMIEEERESTGEKKSEGDNLLSVLIRSSQSEGRSVLNDEEIIGNMFIYNLAGHDTTANTLAYAITMLAMDLRIQEWIGEEVLSVFGNGEELEYENIFPRLKRCLAVMYETLRLYGPIVFIPKYTVDSQRLTIQGNEFLIPSDTHVIVNIAALHTFPSYWGNDCLVWRPDRWIDENEEFIQPAPGTFMPWASGPRVCPGKKFAQVEFVAVVAWLFRRNRVRPKTEAGEKVEETFRRVKEIVDDSELQVTLNMKHPERIRLIWEDGV